MSDEKRRRLYRVRAEVELVCWADDETDARMEADRYAAEELRNNTSTDLDITEITSEAKVPRDWRGATPYGDPPEDDENPWEETCADAARRIEEAAKAEKLAAEHMAAQGVLPLVG